MRNICSRGLDAMVCIAFGFSRYSCQQISLAVLQVVKGLKVQPADGFAAAMLAALAGAYWGAEPLHLGAQRDIHVAIPSVALRKSVGLNVSVLSDRHISQQELVHLLQVNESHEQLPARLDAPESLHQCATLWPRNRCDGGDGVERAGGAV